MITYAIKLPIETREQLRAAAKRNGLREPDYVRTILQLAIADKLKVGLLVQDKQAA